MNKGSADYFCGLIITGEDRHHIDGRNIGDHFPVHRFGCPNPESGAKVGSEYNYLEEQNGLVSRDSRFIIGYPQFSTLDEANLICGLSCFYIGPNFLKPHGTIYKGPPEANCKTFSSLNSIEYIGIYFNRRNTLQLEGKKKYGAHGLIFPTADMPLDTFLLKIANLGWITCVTPSEGHSSVASASGESTTGDSSGSADSSGAGNGDSSTTSASSASGTFSAGLGGATAGGSDGGASGGAGGEPSASVKGTSLDASESDTASLVVSSCSCEVETVENPRAHFTVIYGEPDDLQTLEVLSALTNDQMAQMMARPNFSLSVYTKMYLDILFHFGLKSVYWFKKRQEVIENQISFEDLISTRNGALSMFVRLRGLEDAAFHSYDMLDIILTLIDEIDEVFNFSKEYAVVNLGFLVDKVIVIYQQRHYLPTHTYYCRLLLWQCIHDAASTASYKTALTGYKLLNNLCDPPADPPAVSDVFCHKLARTLWEHQLLCPPNYLPYLSELLAEWKRCNYVRVKSMFLTTTVVGDLLRIVLGPSNEFEDGLWENAKDQPKECGNMVTLVIVSERLISACGSASESAPFVPAENSVGEEVADAAEVEPPATALLASEMFSTGHLEKPMPVEIPTPETKLRFAKIIGENAPFPYAPIVALIESINFRSTAAKGSLIITIDNIDEDKAAELWTAVTLDRELGCYLIQCFGEILNESSSQPVVQLASMQIIMAAYEKPSTSPSFIFDKKRSHSWCAVINIQGRPHWDGVETCLIITRMAKHMREKLWQCYRYVRCMTVFLSQTEKVYVRNMYTRPKYEDKYADIWTTRAMEVFQLSTSLRSCISDHQLVCRDSNERIILVCFDPVLYQNVLSNISSLLSRNAMQFKIEEELKFIPAV